MSPEAFLEKSLDTAQSWMAEAGVAACHYDRDTVVWLDGHLRRLRAVAPTASEETIAALGTLLGQCFATALGGEWARVNGGLAVRIGKETFVVPWNKIEGFLGGDDGDDVIGFFDGVGRHYAHDASSKPRFIM